MAFASPPPPPPPLPFFSFFFFLCPNFEIRFGLGYIYIYKSACYFFLEIY
jgi:hypothetical protein